MSNFICDTFESFGYKVNNKDGTEDLIINTADMALFIIYLGLSVDNLLSGEPTEVGFVINFILLLRLIAKNLLEQAKLTKKKKYIGMRFTLIHLLKISGEIIIICLISVFYFCFKNLVPAAVIYKPYIGVILAVTVFENFLTFLERLYDATPMAIIKYTE